MDAFPDLPPLPTIGPVRLDATCRTQLLRASAACRRVGKAVAEPGSDYQVGPIEAPVGSATARWRRGGGKGDKYTPADAQRIRSVYQDLAREFGHRDRCVPFDERWVCGLHKRLAASVDTAKATPGAIRTGPVGVGQYRAPDAATVPTRFAALVRFAERVSDPLLEWLDGDPIAAGIARAALVHADFLKLHPFGDGNGRVARAIDFALLLDAGLSPQVAEAMRQHYIGTRFEYCARLGAIPWQGVSPFVTYAAHGMSNRLDDLDGTTGLLTRRELLRAGYSLLELMAVTGIVGTVAALVLPRVANSSATARQVVERMNVRQIQQAIERYQLTNGGWPTTLDSAANTVSSAGNPLFDSVLGIGDTSGQWTKIGALTYTGPTGTAYEFDNINGFFSASGGGGGGGTTGTGGGGVTVTLT